jgi:hypothetical protein
LVLYPSSEHFHDLGSLPWRGRVWKVKTPSGWS